MAGDSFPIESGFPRASQPAEEPIANLITLARTFLLSGAYGEAETYARRALAAQKQPSPEAIILAATCALRRGKLGEANQFRDRLEGAHLGGRVQAELRVLDARLLVHQGRYAECVDRFGPILDRAAEDDCDVTIGLNVGQCHARLHSPGTARTAFDWVLAESSRLRWSEGEARARVALALVDRTDGNWARATELLIEAKGTFARLGLLRDYVLTLQALGLQRLLQGELGEAEERLNEAAQLAAEMGEPGLGASLRTGRGLALVRLNRMPEARKESALALRLCRRQPSPRREAIAFECIGEYHLAANQPSRAALALARALRIARRIAPEGDIVPEVLRRQAELALLRGQREEALRLADEAEALAIAVGDRYERATVLRVRGQAFQAGGRTAEARTQFEAALEILKDLGEVFERARMQSLLDSPTAHPYVLMSARPDAHGNAPDIASTEAPSFEADTDSSVHDGVTRRTERQAARQAQGGTDTRFEKFRRMAREQGTIGNSPLLLEVLRRAALVAPTALPVLIQGETGTGKELIARTMHAGGANPTGPFVSFNCATSTAELFDSELFGHARGAYTGATGQRLGLARAADSGTLFLDEIGELGPDSQARLLRMLDSGEIRPVGSDQAVRVNVRIVAATHANLEEGFVQGRFRQDIYYRLSGMRLCLPPLRERLDDLPALIKHFAEEARRDINPEFAGLAEPVVRAMESYAWPGNIRELRHEILSLAALNRGGTRIMSWSPAGEAGRHQRSFSPDEVRAIIDDRSGLQELSGQYRGRMSHLATLMGISRASLYRALRRHGVEAGHPGGPDDGA